MQAQSTDQLSHGLSIDMSPLKENHQRQHQHIMPLRHTRTHTQPRHDFSDSDSDDGQSQATGDLLEKMERRVRNRAREMKQPMSSPVRQLKKESPIASRTLGEKYTLRTRAYVPFAKRERDQKREQRQLQQRGGNDEMTKFMMEQDEKEQRERLQKEADGIAMALDEMSEISEEEEDPYQRELEEMLKQEEEELDALISGLSLE